MNSQTRIDFLRLDGTTSINLANVEHIDLTDPTHCIIFFAGGQQLEYTDGSEGYATIKRYLESLSNT